jgi:hypothetical protein
MEIYTEPVSNQNINMIVLFLIEESGFLGRERTLENGFKCPLYLTIFKTEIKSISAPSPCFLCCYALAKSLYPIS